MRPLTRLQRSFFRVSVKKKRRNNFSPLGILLSDLNSLHFRNLEIFINVFKVLTDSNLVILDELLIKQGIFHIKFIDLSLSNLVNHIFRLTFSTDLLFRNFYFPFQTPALGISKAPHHIASKTPGDNPQ